MEKKNAWEKYPEGKKRDEVFSFAEDYRKIYLRIVRQNVNAPVQYIKMP